MDLVKRQSRSHLLLAKEVIAFGTVGAVNFLTDLAVYQGMYSGLHVGALQSKVVSTVVTSSIAYFLHRHWSFSHRARSGLRREFVAFVVLSLISLAIGLLLIGAVRYGLGATDVRALQAANVISILVGAAFRFWAYKKWVFLPPSPAVQTEQEPVAPLGGRA